MNSISKLVLTLTVLFTLTFVSCNKEDYPTIEPEQISSTEQLKQDTRFIEMINENQAVVEQVKDVSKIEALTSKDDLSEFELEELAKALGFENFESYERYYISHTETLNQLEEDYNISTLKNAELESAIESVYIMNESVSFRNDPCYCQRTFYNCAASVTATAAGLNLACMGLIASGVGTVAGIACHAAAIVWQAAASDQCLVDDQICRQNCN